nr:unnamed protein product [Callosobruchus chinensis]
MLKIVKSLTKGITWIMSAQRSIRYFPNPKPDYQQETGTPSIPNEDLKTSLSEILDKITFNILPIEKNGGNGIYLGTAGIAYMYYHLSKIPMLEAERNDFLNKAIEYLKPALMVASCSAHKKKDVPSFILGNCGIYAVAAAIFKAIGDEQQCKQYYQLYFEAASICKDFNFLSCGSDELFVGRAGYVLGALWMAKETNTPLPMQEIYRLCKIIVQSGRNYSKRYQLPCPLMYAYYQVEYLGAAHGLCSILQLLISVPGYLDATPTDATDIKRSIDYLLSFQSDDGNFPAATDEIGYHRSWFIGVTEPEGSST